MLSVITSRSSLVKGMNVRAAVRFHMSQIRIFGQLLFLVCHVDQKVISVTLYIAFDDCLDLLFV